MTENMIRDCKVSADTSGGVVEWLTRRTSNLWTASHMGSNPVNGKKPLFP